MRHLQRLFITASFLTVLLAVPSQLQAEQEVSSSLLLPYFEVDLDGGLTTAFSVTNASDEPAEFQISVYTNWGIRVLSVPALLDSRGVLTVNLSHWLIGGTLPDRSLTAAELEHLQAALCGLVSPQDNKFYSSAVAPRLAVGYVKIEAYGTPRSDSLFGNYFIIDPLQHFAQGDALISLDGGCQGACRRHAVRYLAGGLFDGGTEVLIWTGVEGRPTSSGYPRPQDMTPASTLFFNEQGETHDQRDFDFMAVEVVDLADLGLAHPFGWLEIITENRSFVSLRMSAMGRFSVGLRTFCMRDPIGPGIRIEKSTNGHDADTAPGPSISVGDPVTWEYRVTNTGDQDLTDVLVDDDQGVAVSCPQTTLAAGESMTCTGNGFAVSGQYRNCGTATGLSALGGWVTDVDCSHYWGGCPQGGNPAIEIEKSTNGHDADAAPGPSIPIGDPVQWAYVVTNSGDEALDNISVSDDQGVTVSCPGTSLQPGESMTCTGSGTAVAGQYQNVGSASGTTAGTASCPGTTVSDDDPSHYWGACAQENPSIDIEKATNGHDADAAPGPTLLVGDPVQWTYFVTNDGDVALDNVSVSDDQGVAVSCPRASLSPGQSMTCTGNGTAILGQYQNVGTASGTSAGSASCPGSTVSDSDLSHYWGACAQENPSIDIEKATNGQDADAAPGPSILIGDPVQWTYFVTNDGDVALDNVSVSDDQGVAVSCPRTSLSPGQSMTCTGNGTAILGQYQNVGTASGTSAGSASCPGSTVSDSDLSHYWGACAQENPSIDIEKATNGQDADAAPGPTLEVGDPVQWTYVVTNDGDVALDNVSVSDDQGVAVSCPGTSLQPGESMTCTGSGIAILGQYQNLGTATAVSVGSASCPGSAVSDDDLSHYWGDDPPGGGTQGCTPGYWKVPQHHDSWLLTNYSTDQLVPTVWVEAGAYPEPAVATLLEALSFNGGPTDEDAAKILLRAAVAGVLNATHPGVDYPRTEASLISDVNAALASGDRATMLALKDAIDADNNLGCPLN